MNCWEVFCGSFLVHLGGFGDWQFRFFYCLKVSLLGLLLTHHLELVDLLQLGDLEGAVGLSSLLLEVVDLHVPLLDGVLHVELLAEDGAALVVQLLHQGGEVVLGVSK